MEEIRSTVTGSVWKLLVRPGDEVTATQELMILESMKMEIPVVAGTAGTVVAIESIEGQAVNTGDVLARIEVGE